MNINFNNKTVLVTGASRGIGKDIAKKFYKLGANVITTSTKNKSSSKINNQKNLWTHISVDFNDIDSLNDFLKKIRLFKKIDILINNAGINKIDNFTSIKNEDWYSVNNINLTAPFLIAKNIAKKMENQKHGHIVNIASIFGVVSKKKRASYSAAKSGLIGLSKAMALDLAKYNIMVNSVSPGFVMTDLTRSILSEKEINKLIRSVPLERFARIEEITDLIIFLCSKYNSYLTGQNIIIDGGYTIK